MSFLVLSGLNAIDLNLGAQFVDRSCDTLVVAAQLFRRPLIGGDLNVGVCENFAVGVTNQCDLLKPVTR